MKKLASVVLAIAVAGATVLAVNEAQANSPNKPGGGGPPLPVALKLLLKSIL